MDDFYHELQLDNRPLWSELSVATRLYGRVCCKVTGICASKLLEAEPQLRLLWQRVKREIPGRTSLYVESDAAPYLR